VALDSILGGASNFNFFGSGTSNKSSRLYRALFGAQVAGYAAAGLGWYLDRRGVRSRPFQLPFHALYVYLAAFIGVLRALKGARPVSLIAPPLMHATGLVGAISALAGGGSVAFLTSRKFDPIELWNEHSNG